MTLKQYTKFLMLTSENRKKSHLLRKIKIKFEMDGKLCPGIMILSCCLMQYPTKDILVFFKP